MSSSSSSSIQIKVVNLERRPDRRAAMEAQLFSLPYPYTFVPAVDGLRLVANRYLATLFRGNDFGSRRGVIGCALTHMYLWQQLVQEKDVATTYLILEDDVTLLTCIKEGIAAALEVEVEEEEDLCFLGVSTWNSLSLEKAEAEAASRPVVKVPWNKSKYIGGTFAYMIRSSGAKKLLDTIQERGIRHGIDYFIKMMPPTLKCVEIDPLCVHSAVALPGKPVVDSDIQYNLDTLDVLESMALALDDYVFFPGVDSSDNDLCCIKRPLKEVLKSANDNQLCLAFNTLGFMKSAITWPLRSTPYIGGSRGGGIYVKKSEAYWKVHISGHYWESPEACWNEFGASMTSDGWYWDDAAAHESKRGIQRCDKPEEADFFVVINRPGAAGLYGPKERTIVCQMEPWIGSGRWGIHSWGEWADPQGFLSVIGKKSPPHTGGNTGFWQLGLPLHELENLPPFNKADHVVSTVCSHKYFDRGHILRLDFLRFLEAKGFPIDIYSKTNSFPPTHGPIQGYCGPLYNDKYRGILPYKYYFMVENNFEPGYITEKLWEPLLCETLCFYMGAPDVAKFIDPEAFVQLDLTKGFESALQQIQQTIAEDGWSKRIGAIRREKKRILGEYGFFPRVAAILAAAAAIRRTG
jgi:GR25 family glycosyltransferase involved in LPS biosynthesis